MQFIVLAALVFGACFLVDKGFTKIFRNQAQHKTGLALRLNKRYALFGLVLAILGILGILVGIAENLLLTLGGIFVLILGAAMIIYYMAFGIFYDADSFLVTTFGKKTANYRFEDITSQRLYVVQGGNLLIELYLKDGRTVSVQSAMEGAYPFLDHAFSAWCRQTGRDPESCDFHDPAQGQWFPVEEDA